MTSMTPARNSKANSNGPPDLRPDADAGQVDEPRVRGEVPHGGRSRAASTHQPFAVTTYAAS